MVKLTLLLNITNMNLFDEYYPQDKAVSKELKLSTTLKIKK